MMARVILALMMVLTFTGLAWAQSPVPGSYTMEWSILHTPVSSDLPDLVGGTTPIDIETATTPLCPPTSAFVIRNAPSSATTTVTWCLLSDGSFDTSAGVMGSGGLVQFPATPDIFYVKGTNHRGNDTVLAVGRKEVPPPAALSVSMTAPHNGDTVSGTNWVVLWVNGGGTVSKTYSLSVDGKAVGTPQTTTSNGPVTLPWSTTSFPNGTHTLTGSVSTADGATGSVSISILVSN